MFVEWYAERTLDDALLSAIKQKPKVSDGIDNGYDHYYTVQVKTIGKPEAIKEAIKGKLANLPNFAFYPSDYAVQYAGIKDDSQVFYILGYLNRETKGDEETGWLPPKGVYAPNKVVQTRLSAEN